MELTSPFVDFNTNLTRLIEKDVHNEQQIKDVLVSSKDEIIEMFGGLLNMIQLCLMNTNTHCIEKINKIKLKSFEKLLNDNKIVIPKSSKTNLFDDYSISDDIKTEIVLCLTEHEVHNTISYLDYEWNKLCKATYDNRKFQYKFIDFCKNLMNEERGGK